MKESEDYRKGHYAGGTIDWEGIIKELKIDKDKDGYEHKHAVID
ncbi:hypothetical protein ES703_66874 [subsurface metagenome]